MNYYHKKKLKRKILRQIQKGRKFIRFTFKYKWPSLSPCSEIVGIQPMDGPVGTVFHLTNKYESLRNN